MEVMVIDRGHGKEWSGWFPLLIKASILRDCNLQHTNFLILSNKDLVIESTVVPVHVLGKQEEIKAVSVLTRLHRHKIFETNSSFHVK